MTSVETLLRHSRQQFWFVAVAIFLILNVVVRHTGGVNAASRYALSMGMVTNQTFSIDGYQTITPDWSQTPDGRYFSNKPPGPSIFGFPIAWIVDAIAIDRNASPDEQYTQRMRIWANSQALQAFVLQVLPTVIVAVAMDVFLAGLGLSLAARGFALIGLLFGTTPSFLLNTMFGHGMAAWCVLAALIAASSGRLIWSGLWFGMALLADYGSAFVLPGLLWVWFSDQKPLLVKIRLVGQGALLPAVIWIWYHTLSFGSPLVTSHKFLAPEWVSVPTEKNALWGVFATYPDFGVLAKLVFARERGLLFTQPWVLVVVAMSASILPNIRKTSNLAFRWALVACSTLVMLILVNAAFNGWHGGATIGPRYLSPVLFLFPVLAAIVYDVVGRRVKMLLVATLGVAVFYYAIGFTQDILTDMDPWPELFGAFFRRNWSAQIKILILGGMVMWAWYVYAVKPLRPGTGQNL